MNPSMREKKTAIIVAVVAAVLVLLIGFWVFDRNDAPSQPPSEQGSSSLPGQEGDAAPRPADPGRVTALPLAPPPPVDASPPTTGMSRAEVSLPADFPVPDGAVFIEDVSDGPRHTVLFSVNSAADAAEFYRAELPASRFYVAQARQDPTGQASAEFTFYARGSDLPMVLTIEGQTARLLWEDAPPPPAPSPDDRE